MRRAATTCEALVVAAALAGCLPDATHRCQGGDCGDGVCLTPPGACAFDDDTCPSGLRFGDGTGAQAGTCAPPADAGVDAPLGHDEDGDGVADVDDNCPHVANPQQEDTTEVGGGRQADGVGDACDPQPLSANALVLFDGFGRADADGWTVANGALVVDADALALASGATLSSALPLTHDLVLAARVRPGTGAPGSNYALVGAASSPTSGVVCTRRNQTDGSGQLAVSRLGGVNGTVAAAPALEADVAEIVTQTLTGSGWRCDLVHLRGTATVMRLASLTLGDGLVGLVASSGPIDIDWIVAISLMPGVAP